jgi:hypothetical protein
MQNHSSHPSYRRVSLLVVLNRLVPGQSDRGLYTFEVIEFAAGSTSL